MWLLLLHDNFVCLIFAEDNLFLNVSDIPHIGPASEAETLSFMWVSQERHEEEKMEVCTHKSL